MIIEYYENKPMPRYKQYRDAQEIILLSGGSFSRWLKRTIEKSEMSLATIAESSGVSYQTISKIINGSTPNPQASTKERLASALHQKIPKQVQDSSSSETFVEGLGDLADFNPYETSELPNCGGVYVFYDISNRPIYIGKSSNIAGRVKSHSDKFWFKPPIVTAASYIKVDDDKLRTQIEQILIKFLRNNAVINKQNVVR